MENKKDFEKYLKALNRVIKKSLSEMPEERAQRLILFFIENAHSNAKEYQELTRVFMPTEHPTLPITLFSWN